MKDSRPGYVRMGLSARNHLTMMTALLLVSMTGCSQKQIQQMQAKAQTLTQQATSGITSLGQSDSTGRPARSYTETPIDGLFTNSAFQSSDGYPRLALEIVEAPPMHDEIVGTQPRESGCWVLEGTLWRSASQSTPIRQFSWCSTQDVVYDVPLQQASHWYLKPTLGIAPQIRTTGTEPTSGPYPPKNRYPTNPRSSKWFRHGPFNMMTYDGLMMTSLLYKTGMNYDDRSDYRLWFYNVPNG